MKEYTQADHKNLEQVGNEMDSIIRFKLDQIKGMVRDAESKLSYNAYAAAQDHLRAIIDVATVDGGVARLIEATRPKQEE